MAIFIHCASILLKCDERIDSYFNTSQFHCHTLNISMRAFMVLPMVPLEILPMVPLVANGTIGLPLVPMVPLGGPMVPLALPLASLEEP